LLASLEPLPRRQQRHDRWQRRAALRAALWRGCHRHRSSVLRDGLSSRDWGRHVSTGGTGSYRGTHALSSICRYTRHVRHAARSSCCAVDTIWIRAVHTRHEVSPPSALDDAEMNLVA